MVSGSKSITLDPAPAAGGESIVYEYVTNQFCESAGGAGQSSWQSDSDVYKLDEYLVELDLKWRLLRRLGMSYSEEYEEARTQIDLAKARNNGGARNISTTGPVPIQLINTNNIPETGMGS
jgi:hypothetical protein